MKRLFMSKDRTQLVFQKTNGEHKVYKTDYGAYFYSCYGLKELRDASPYGTPDLIISDICDYGEDFCQSIKIITKYGPCILKAVRHVTSLRDIYKSMCGRMIEETQYFCIENFEEITEDFIDLKKETLSLKRLNP